MTDQEERKPVRLHELKDGDVLDVLGNGVCIAPGLYRVRFHEGQPYVFCSDGIHYLCGQTKGFFGEVPKDDPTYDELPGFFRQRMN